MAAILRDSTVVVVRTRPWAIPLAKITWENQLMGFLLFAIWVWGSPWRPFEPPELRYKTLGDNSVLACEMLSSGCRPCLKRTQKLNLSTTISSYNLAIGLIRHVTEFFPAETGEYCRVFPNFQTRAWYRKDLKDNRDSSLHLARIVILGHYLYLEAICSLLGTYIFPRTNILAYFRAKLDYCLYSAPPRKIPWRVVVVREKISVNKWAYRK